MSQITQGRDVVDTGLFIEGQNGLTWDGWSRLLSLAEGLGFRSIMRSDHFFETEQQDSLEAYLSFAVAARETNRIRFGPLVTPVMFRSPVDVGRMAAQLDLISRGRFVLGLGVGGHEAEHHAYGIPFPPVGERFDRLEEAIAVIKSLWSPGPAQYRGRFYRLEGADSLPKPAGDGPPIVVGGTGERRTLRVAARHASEWNCDGFLPANVYSRKTEALRRHSEAAGRDPASLRRSMAVFNFAIGPAGAGAPRYGRLARVNGWGQSLEGALTGTVNQVMDQLGPLADLGLQEVMFDHGVFDSDDFPEYLASELAPALQKL